MVSLWVRLTFSQMYPSKRHLMVKNGTNLGLVDLSSDVIPLIEKSSGQKWYYIRSA